MFIKVDTREQDLLKRIHYLVTNIPIFKSLTIKTEALHIGDIIIEDENGTEKLIIERKSVTDLLASIKDGRYEEQSYRLNGLTHHNHNIIYLIEGDVAKANRFKSDNSVEKLTLYSAMFSLNYFKGFSVFRTFSMDETALTICNMANKLQKTSNSKTAYYKNDVEDCTLEINDNTSEKTSENITIPSIVVSEKDYVSVIKKVKKDNITPDNIGEIMLCQIPGISSVTALAVLAKYETLPNLIKEIETNNECLTNITYTNSKGQTRKINKASIANIVKFLTKK